MLRDSHSILLAFSQTDGQDRAIRASLYMHLMRRPGWSAYLIDPQRLTPQTLVGVRMGAVVGRIDAALARAVGGRLPLISTSRGLAAEANCYSVVIDDDAIGRSAADYFVDRGFKRFAYVGSGRLLSQRHGSAFAARLADVHLTPRTYLGPDTGVAPWSPMAADRELTAWVQGLPVSTAVLAENDLVGFRISEICRHFGIAIPYTISMIGVGNDELMCRLCHPPLTTIATSNEQTGVAIAELLDRLMAGERPAARTITLPPAGVIERQSADTVRFDDAEVANAFRYINENAQKSIAIGDIVAAVFTSRRTLERRFRRVVGMSLQAAITHARVNRAKGLLAYSRSPIQTVAKLSGLSSAQRFHIVFRRIAGMTPLAYRQQFQAAGLQKSTTT